MDNDNRWGIWIDIEGFSSLWSASSLALRGLGTLTELIFEIGRNCYPDAPDRLFAHQIGDGFYIASDFHEESLDRCAAIAIVLMRGLTNAGCVGRAAISEGPLADYAGCRPSAVKQEAGRNGDQDVVSLGAGLMTLQAVMGQGLINAVALDKATNTKGALLTLSKAHARRLSAGFITIPLETTADILAIDWVHSQPALIEQIARRATIPMPVPRELELRIDCYVRDHKLPDAWSDPTFRYAGIPNGR